MGMAGRIPNGDLRNLLNLKEMRTKSSESDSL